MQTGFTSGIGQKFIGSTNPLLIPGEAPVSGHRPPQAIWPAPGSTPGTQLFFEEPAGLVARDARPAHDIDALLLDLDGG